MNISKGIITLSFITLSACTHVPVKESITREPTIEQKSLAVSNAEALHAWNLTGAIAARNNQHSWSAIMHWQQNGSNNYHIHLSGPLGGGNVFIVKKGNMIDYTDGKVHKTSSNAAELLQQQTGVRLPVQNLYYWVRGIPAPGSVQHIEHDASGHMLTFTQSGYTMHYSAYSIVKNVPLPSKIILAGHGVVIKLAVKHWEI